MTAQMMTMDVYTGELRFVNAGRYSPLLIHDHKVVEQLSTPTTLPVGLNGEAPEVSGYSLSEGDRLLCYTDGVIEEHMGQMAFGEEQFINLVDRVEQADEGGVRSTARALSHVLKRRRGWKTSDDATLFMIEWKGSANRHYALRSERFAVGPAGPEGLAGPASPESRGREASAGATGRDQRPGSAAGPLAAWPYRTRP